MREVTDFPRKSIFTVRLFSAQPRLRLKIYSFIAALPLRENVTVHRTAKDAVQVPTFSRGVFRNIFSGGTRSRTEKTDSRDRTISSIA